MSRAATLALVAVLAGGCYGGWRREYPPDWPRRLGASAGQCPDVAGVWRGTAEEDPFSFERAQLGALADAWDPSPAAARDPGASRPVVPPRVRIAALAGGELELTNLAADGNALARRLLRRGADFECEDGLLVLSPPGGPAENANLCVAKSWRRFGLTRDTSGALVVRKGVRDLCVGLLGGAYGWSADWSRFLPASP